MQSRRIRIKPGDFMIGPTGEIGPSLAQLIGVLRFLWGQLQKLLEFLDGRHPVVGGLIGFSKLQMGLRLLGHQSDGTLELAHSLGIFSERQQTGTEQQPRRAIVRLKGKRFTKSRNSFRVLAALLRDDAEVVIDERMLDSVLESSGEDFFGSDKIARFQRLDSGDELFFERRRQTFLRGGGNSGMGKQQKKKTRGTHSEMTSRRADQLDPNIRHCNPTANKLLDEPQSHGFG